jgi:hypothetical protein
MILCLKCGRSYVTLSIQPLAFFSFREFLP